MERHAKKEKRTWKEDERAINRFSKHWFNKNAVNIKKEDVLEIHQKIGSENGIYTANRLFEILRSIYNKAIEWGLIKTENPAIGIKRFKEKSRERFLQSDEIARFFKRVMQ